MSACYERQSRERRELIKSEQITDKTRDSIELFESVID